MITPQIHSPKLGKICILDKDVHVTKLQSTPFPTMEDVELQIIKTVDAGLREILAQQAFKVNDVTTRKQCSDAASLFLTEHCYDYAFICNETNNTAATINAGELHVFAYFKPTVFSKEFLYVSAKAANGTPYMRNVDE